MPNKAIPAALSPFGKVYNIKMGTYKGMDVGVRNLLIDFSLIPSAHKIADHCCNIFYPGQTPTCFACHQSGHTRAYCPGTINHAAPAVEAD